MFILMGQRKTQMLVVLLYQATIVISNVYLTIHQHNSIGNKRLDIKPTIGEYQPVVRNIRKEEVVLARLRLGHKRVTHLIPGRVAQSVTCLATDACLTAIPGVASSIPARSHTFVEIDHEIISTVILLPSADSFKKGCCQLQVKVCAQITG